MQYGMYLLALGLAGVPAAAQPAAPRVRLSQEIRLDATAEDFPGVGRVYVGPEGQIVVPILADQHLRVYDSTGRRIAIVGRRGGGPGEFTTIGTVGWLGDTLWAGDAGQRRTVFVGPDLKVLRTESWPVGERVERGVGPFSYFAPVMLLPGGAIIGQALEQAPPRRAVLVLRSSLGETKVVFSMPPSEESERMIWVAGAGFGVPFSLQPQYAFTWDGSHFAELTAPIPSRRDGTFTVSLLRASGDTVFSRTYHYRGVPIPRRVADSAVAALRPTPGHIVNAPADMAEQVQAQARARMSSWYIPVESILLGLDRTVWIGLRATEAGRGYLILNNRGDPVGSLMVPASTRVRQASATRIWVTETDDDGLSSVVRYRVSGLSCGPPGC